MTGQHEAMRAALLSTRIPQHEGGGYEVAAADAFMVSLIDRITAQAQANAALQGRLDAADAAASVPDAPAAVVPPGAPQHRGERPGRAVPLVAWRSPALVAGGVLVPVLAFLLT